MCCTVKLGSVSACGWQWWNSGKALADVHNPGICPSLHPALCTLLRICSHMNCQSKRLLLGNTGVITRAVDFLEFANLRYFRCTTQETPACERQKVRMDWQYRISKSRARLWTRDHTVMLASLLLPPVPACAAWLLPHGCCRLSRGIPRPTHDSIRT